MFKEQTSVAYYSDNHCRKLFRQMLSRFFGSSVLLMPGIVFLIILLLLFQACFGPSIKLSNLNLCCSVVFILGHVLVQFHTVFVYCRHIRSVLYVSFCLFVTNKFNLI